MKFSWGDFMYVLAIGAVVSIYFALTLSKIESLNRDVEDAKIRQQILANKIDDVSVSCQTLEKELEAMSLKGLIFKKRQK